jgi:dTDP-4-amino-4,6-dideoxygalactose transaminase
MNELAATLGLASLEHVGEIESRYRANGAFYEQALANIPGVTRLRQQAGTTSGWWTYSLLAERRDDLIAKLHSAGIGAQRLHLRHDAYSCFASLPSRPLPGVTSFDAANISLPCGWWVTEQDRERVANCVREGW